MAGNHPVHIHPVRSLLHHLERAICLLENPKLMTAGLLGPSVISVFGYATRCLDVVLRLFCHA